MEGVRFWSRVGHWFKRGDAFVLDRADENGSGDVADAPRIIPSKRGANGDGNGGLPKRVVSDPTRGWTGLPRIKNGSCRWWNPSGNTSTPRPGAPERMAASMDRLGEALVRLPVESETQTGLLRSISESLTAEAAATKRIEEGLSQVPRIADAQRETMVAMGRQLDATRQTSDRVGGAVEDVRKAITDLGAVTGSTSKTMQEIWSQASVREERLADLMAEQTRRLTWFAWSAIGLAGIAAAVAVVGLLM